MSFRLEVLYEDLDLLACNKPSGIVTHATLDTKRAHFYGLVRESVGPEAAQTLALHHRLDAQTSGVLLFAKTKRMNQPLQDLFRQHHISKTYLAVTAAGGSRFQFEDTFSIRNYLALSQKKPARSIAVKSGGKPAQTDFQILRKTKNFWVIRAQPKTGRAHQIRTHLATAGIPLIADTLYGGHSSQRTESFLLHACRLDFTHPLTEASISVEAPLPARFHEFTGPNLALYSNPKV